MILRSRLITCWKTYTVDINRVPNQAMSEVTKVHPNLVGTPCFQLCLNTGEFFTVRFDADNPSHLNNIRQTFASMLSDRYPMIAQDILLAH